MLQPTPTTHHTAENLQARALGMVSAYYNTFVAPKTTLGDLQPDEIFVVWFCKTLQNWKALIATHRPENLYFEVTHNGNEKCTYIDQYVKLDNYTIYDEEPTFDVEAAGKPIPLTREAFLAGVKHPDDITDQPELYPTEWRPTGVDNSGKTKLADQLSALNEKVEKVRQLPQVFQNLNPAGPDRFA
jgi:Family of unknown function (DUF6275)